MTYDTTPSITVVAAV